MSERTKDSRRERDRRSRRRDREREREGESGSGRSSSRRDGPATSRSAAVATDDAGYLHPSAAAAAPPVPAVPSSYQQQHPQQQQQPQLRPAESRFSLRDQFASTRQEYNFDDDGSSIFDRLTLASGLGAWAGGKPPIPEQDDDDDDDNDDDYEEDIPVKEEPGALYDLLCLPPGGDGVTSDMVRASYFRLLPLMRPDACPEHLTDVALRGYEQLQYAFETLVDPIQRAEYDTGKKSVPLSERDVYERVLRPPAMSTRSDMWVRFDATQRPAELKEQEKVVTPSWGRRLTATATAATPSVPEKTTIKTLIKDKIPTARPLDFALSHEFTIGVPVLGPKLRKTVCSIKDIFPKRQPAAVMDVGESGVLIGADGEEEKEKEKEKEKVAKKGWELRMGEPSLTLAGTVYGRLDERELPLATRGRYRPLIPAPTILPKGRLPAITARLSQPILHRTGPTRPWSYTVLSACSRPIPFTRVVEAHIAHQIPLARPILLEALVRADGWGPGTLKPHVALGSRVQVGDDIGAAYLRVEGVQHAPLLKAYGWRALRGSDLARVELGFETGPNFGSLKPTNTPVRTGMHALDTLTDYTTPSWTVSGSATPSELSAVVRYTKDLNSTYTVLSPRVEAETSASSIPIHQHLALRFLWPVGRYARLGLELASTPTGNHLSLYWSRLDQRLSLPVLLASPSSPQHVMGWLTTVAPVAATIALTAMGSFITAFRRRHRRRRRTRRTPRRPQRIQDLDADALASHVANTRAYADDLTVLMGPVVESSQRRLARHGGVVIYSAKLGVRDTQSSPTSRRRVVFAPAEEVADVTVAFAALVEPTKSYPMGRVWIPAGVRWGGLPGFWDPSPHVARGGDGSKGDKVLVVKYRIGERGDERVAVFSEGEEVVVPSRKH